MSSRKRPRCKQYGVVPYESYRKSLIIYKEKTKEMFIDCLFYLIKTRLNFTSNFFISLAQCAVSFKC